MFGIKYVNYRTIRIIYTTNLSKNLELTSALRITLKDACVSQQRYYHTNYVHSEVQTQELKTMIGCTDVTFSVFLLNILLSFARAVVESKWAGFIFTD